MRIKTFKRWTAVRIEWVDSMHTSGWTKADGHEWDKQDEYLKHTSLGYIAHQSALSIQIVQSMQIWPGGEIGNVDAIMQIPCCAITKIEAL